MKIYGVNSVPTTVIDREVKVVGIPDFPWIRLTVIINRCNCLRDDK
jgi:hypothetical protein